MVTTTALRLDTYLHFDGRAREALEFYKSVFGGELTLTTWGDSPLPDRAGDPPADGIMHGRLIAGSAIIMASDTPGPGSKPQGFNISASVATAEEGRRVFDALAEGGEVSMPFQSTFWSAGFGMLSDRFGTPWLVNTEDPT